MATKEFLFASFTTEIRHNRVVSKGDKDRRYSCKEHAVKKFEMVDSHAETAA